MTKLLARALERVQALPDNEQDAIAARLLEELELSPELDAELDEAITEFEANPADVTPWGQAHDEILLACLTK
jgi:hypothetical protein